VVSFGLVDKGGPRDFSQFWRNKKQQKSKSLHARTPFLRGRVATKPPPTAMDFKATQKKERKGDWHKHQVKAEGKSITQEWNKATLR